MTKQSQISSSTDTEICYDLQILRSIRKIIRAIDVRSKRLKSEHDITTPQLVCLTSIVENGPITSTEISKDVNLSTSTLVGIIDRLENSGFAKRFRRTNDRRVIDIQATEKGRKLVKKIPSPMQESFTQAINSLPEHEQASILASLLKIINLMEAEHLEAAPILETGILIPRQ